MAPALPPRLCFRTGLRQGRARWRCDERPAPGHGERLWAVTAPLPQSQPRLHSSARPICQRMCMPCPPPGPSHASRSGLILELASTAPSTPPCTASHASLQRLLPCRTAAFDPPCGRAPAWKGPPWPQPGRALPPLPPSPTTLLQLHLSCLPLPLLPCSAPTTAAWRPSTLWAPATTFCGCRTPSR